MSREYLCALFLCLGLPACSVIPDLPGDNDLPVQQILLHTACELRDAFHDLAQPEYKSVAGKAWLVAVTLTPKADREVTASLGLTGKSTSNAKATTFTGWSVSGPGLQYDAKGTRNATAVYNLKSQDLINDKKFPLVCDTNSVAYTQLAEHLGIREWLVRNASAIKGSVGNLASLDKPTFSSEIVVKYNADGAFTYTFPFGTDFGGLAGMSDTDLTLSIALSPATVPSVITVQTLPTGGQFGDRPPDKVAVPSHVDASTRLDDLTSEQNIINAINGLK